MALDAAWIRLICLFLPALILLDLWLWKLPDKREMGAACLSFLWTLPSLLLLHIVALHFSFWEFPSEKALLLGIPIDLYIGWGLLWGPIPLLAFRQLSVLSIFLIMLIVDLLFMPLLEPVLILNQYWLIGEIAALTVVLVPAQLLGRWTRDQSQLVGRGILQVFCFIGLAGLFLPAVICASTEDSISVVFEIPLWQSALFFQLVAWSSVIGVSGVQEFVQVGKGTPFPFDPPKRLVVSGMYRYIRNPMQTSTIFVPLFLGAWIGSYWIMGISLMAFIYSVGFAAWSEERDLQIRFGKDWSAYASEVRKWIPRLVPLVKDDAVLYFSANCGVCSDLAQKIARLNPKGLRLVPAEMHPHRDLNRVTYELSDQNISAEGIVAIARALEHVNIAWAFLGSFIRLPIIHQLLQLITDSIGGGPRKICKVVPKKPIVM